MLDRIKQLQEDYPEGSDPLEMLYEWEAETRRKVADVITPYVKIDPHFGDLQWLERPANAEDVELLARAVVWEKLRKGREYRLSQKQADVLADIITAPAGGAR